MNVPEFQLYTFATGSLVHVFFTWLLCFYFDMGFDGACIATGIYYLVTGVHAILLVKFSDKITKFEDVHLFSLETVSNLWPLLELDLKSVGTYIWNFLSLDAFVYISTFLG